MSGVVVAGMHLSGTTLVTKLLESGGWHPGAQVLADDRRNYMEDAGFVELHRSWLGTSLPQGEGHADWGLSTGGLPDSSLLRDPVRSAAVYAERRDAQHGRWVAKDPRATLFLDVWSSLPDLRFVLVYRSPWDVVDSGFRVGHGPFCDRPGTVRDAWLRYNELLLEFADAHPDRCHVVAAEALLRDLTLVRALLDQFLGLDDNPTDGVVDPARFVLRPESHAVAAVYREVYPEHTAVLDELDRRAAAGRAVPTSQPAHRRPVPGGSLEAGTGVQVVIACRDDGDFLAEAVASVDEHHAGPTELTLVDDGSSDPETLRVVDALRRSGRHVVRTDGVGLAAARNLGAATSRTLTLLPLDADNRLERPLLLAAELVEQGEADVVHSPWRRVGTVEGQVDPPPVDARSLLPANSVDACALIRRSLFDELGGYLTGLPYWEDWDLWLGAVARGARFHLIDEVGFSYLERPSSMRRKIRDDAALRDEVVALVVGRHLDVVGPHADALVSAYLDAEFRADARARELGHALVAMRDHAAGLDVRVEYLQGKVAELTAQHDTCRRQLDEVVSRRSYRALDRLLRRWSRLRR